MSSPGSARSLRCVDTSEAYPAYRRGRHSIMADGPTAAATNLKLTGDSMRFLKSGPATRSPRSRSAASGLRTCAAVAAWLLLTASTAHAQSQGSPFGDPTAGNSNNGNGNGQGSSTNYGTGLYGNGSVFSGGSGQNSGFPIGTNDAGSGSPPVSVQVYTGSGGGLGDSLRSGDGSGTGNGNGNGNSNGNGYGYGYEQMKSPPKPSEFELYVKARLGLELPRFGASLLLPATRDFAVPATAPTPGSYEINPGDTIEIHVLGAVRLDLDLMVDAEGTIYLPKIGRVAVAGVRYESLQATVEKAVGKRYRNFETSVQIKKLHGIKVYVTGFAHNPGAYTVSSLATLVNATFSAGGPAPGGSFRSVQLFRHNQKVSDFDLYALLLGADRTHDVRLQNEDVIYIPPVGAQVAIVGSVNAPAIYEAKPGETIGTLVNQYAGGFNSLADNLRVMLYRIVDLDKQGSQEISVADSLTTVAAAGDIVQALSIAATKRPLERQAVLVRLEGEVGKPGEYYVAPNTTLGEVLNLAGGLTPKAFVYGTRLERFSVREQQRVSFQEAVDELEVTLTAAPLSGNTMQDAGVRGQQQKAARDVLDRLKQKEPDGRVVLRIPYEARTLPGDMPLENNDRIYVPPRPTTVGVFGAVYRAGSFELDPGAKIKSYLAEAGGPQDIADQRGIFVVHANGAVQSARNGALGSHALPGDLIFVPIRSQHESWWAKASSISTIVGNFALTLAAFHAVFP